MYIFEMTICIVYVEWEWIDTYIFRMISSQMNGVSVYYTSVLIYSSLDDVMSNVLKPSSDVTDYVSVRSVPRKDLFSINSCGYIYSVLSIPHGISSPNNSEKTRCISPVRARYGGVFCEFIVWPKFLLSPSRIVFSTVLYSTATHRESIVLA